MRFNIILWTCTFFFFIAILTIASPQGVPTADNPKAWEGLTPEDIEKVKNGEIVISAKKRKEEAGELNLIEAAVMFDVNIHTAFRVIKETDKQCEFLHGCYMSYLVERKRIMTLSSSG